MLKRFIASMFIFWVLCAVLGAVICNLIGSNSATAFGVIRIASASTLFALAAFTFTWRATWLPKLQEAYEGTAQADLVAELRESGKKSEHYGGFYRLTYALSVLSGITFASGLVQLFVGMWQTPLAAGVCMGTTGAVSILFGYMLFVMHRIEGARIRKLQAAAEVTHRTPPVSGLTASR